MSKRTAVVILNWNNRNFLEQFLPDVIKYSSSLADIIVADNCSTDDSVSFLEKNFPSVRIIKNSTNEGYTGGYNKSLPLIDNEFYVLLNSDVQVTEGWLINLMNVMDENPNAGAVQPKILSYHTPGSFEYAGAGGGFIDKYGYPFCRGRIFLSIESDHRQYDDTIPVFWSSGACMLVRSDSFRSLGGFDDEFFAHMEEIDFCWRMHNAGQSIYYCGKSVVHHVGGGSLPVESPRKTYLNFRNNLLMIYKNAEPKAKKKILNTRWFLDLLASLRFLFSGGTAHFKAVWRARSDFNKLKHRYSKGFSTVTPSQLPADSLIYPRSILWDYYLCARKKFTLLHWKTGMKR
jgi:GT2 family glycosyltransferase